MILSSGLVLNLTIDLFVIIYLRLSTPLKQVSCLPYSPLTVFFFVPGLSGYLIHIY